MKKKIIISVTLALLMFSSVVYAKTVTTPVTRGNFTQCAGNCQLVVIDKYNSYATTRRISGTDSYNMYVQLYATDNGYNVVNGSVSTQAFSHDYTYTPTMYCTAAAHWVSAHSTTCPNDRYCTLVLNN